MCGDDENIRQIKFDKETLYYGFNENNEWDFAEVMLVRLDGDRYGTS